MKGIFATKSRSYLSNCYNGVIDFANSITTLMNSVSKNEAEENDSNNNDNENWDLAIGLKIARRVLFLDGVGAFFYRFFKIKR